MQVATGTEAVERLMACLPTDAKVEVDAPAASDGVWWYDVTIQGKTDQVGWWPERGYGLYTSDDVGYGENPDVFETDPEAAARCLVGLLAKQAGEPSARA